MDWEVKEFKGENVLFYKGKNYSGSKKCPNVCMIWKDQIGVIH
jgi:hypothetical protein